MILSKVINYLSLHEYRLSELLTVSSLTLTTALATVPVSAAVITFQPGPEGKDTYVDSRPDSNVPGIPPYNLSISHIFLNIKFDKKRKVCQMAQGGSIGGLI